MKKKSLLVVFSFIFLFPIFNRACCDGNIYITSIESDNDVEITFKKNKRNHTLQLRADKPCATSIKIGSFKQRKDNSFELRFLHPFFMWFSNSEQWGECTEIVVVRKNCSYQASYLEMAYAVSGDERELFAKNLITLPEELFEQDQINLKLNVHSQNSYPFKLERIRS